MANAKEILSRIKGVQDTMKITNAMYLISSSKLKKARKSLSDTIPYFETLQETIARILNHLPDITHEYFDTRDDIHKSEKKRGYLVITADKGLAGAYNHNVIKLAEKELQKGEDNILFVVGQVGRHYFMTKDIKIDMEFLYTAQDPIISRARLISGILVDLFSKKELDEVYIIYTKMVSPMKEEAQELQLLPLKRGELTDTTSEGYHTLIEFSPSPEVVMDKVVPNYVTGIIYGALVESYSSEQFSRMTAMESSTENGKKMLKDLTIIYNRVRQAAITQEITEVVGGAKALKNKK